MSEYSLKWKPHQKMKKKNNKIKIHWNDDFPYWIWAHEKSCGAAWFWRIWRHFAQPLFFVQTLSRTSSRFPCWFPQLAHPVSALTLSFSPIPGTGTFLAEKAALFAGKSGVRAFTRCDFLLNTKLHFQQYITAIVQAGLQRIFWGQHPCSCKARPSVIT